MNYELIKNELIKLKKEEFVYIDSIANYSSNHLLTEYEKIEIYRKIKDYQAKITEIADQLVEKIIDGITITPLEKVIIEFDVDKNFLSTIKKCGSDYKNNIFQLGIEEETSKFILTFAKLIRYSYGYVSINPDIIQNKQKLLDEPIYIFRGYYGFLADYDTGPYFSEPADYMSGVYEELDVWTDHPYINDIVEKTIPKRKIPSFEKDKTIIYSKQYVFSGEVKEIFKKELLNVQNKTLNDCVTATRNRIEHLNYIRSTEYKEKVLLDKVSELYKKIKGKFIQEEVLYNGNYLEILRETYQLPNEKIIQKEKLVKNGGKNSVIIVAFTHDEKYIITFQNRIKDTLIAEFPSGYMENDEDPIATAKRELLEETGYTSDDLFVIDEAFTSPGIENSTTYIVMANNCIKTDEVKPSNTELVNYGLFSEKELKYFIYNNIMNGAINKLAYYHLVHNLEDSFSVFANFHKSQKIFKKQRKRNPLDECVYIRN